MKLIYLDIMEIMSTVVHYLYFQSFKPSGFACTAKDAK